MVALVTSPAAIVALAATVLVLGTILLILGFRGRRIDDHPQCRKCGFDLIGLSLVNAPVQNSERGSLFTVRDAHCCPECGTDVTRPRAVRIGRRRKRRGFIIAGSILALIIVSATCVVGWAASTKFNWQAVKPVWWLLDEARGANAAVADAALIELQDRASRQPNPARLLKSCVSAILSEQSHGHKRWNHRLGDLFEDARDAGVVSNAQCATYYRHALKVWLQARQRVRVGETLPVTMFFERRAGMKRTLIYQLLLSEVAIDEQKCPGIGVYTADGMANFRSSHWPLWDSDYLWKAAILPSDDEAYPEHAAHIAVAGPPGLHYMDAVLSVRITIPDALFGGFYLNAWRTPDDAERTMRSEPRGQMMSLWEEKISIPFEVVGPEVEDVEVVADNALRSALKASVKVRIEERLSPFECRVDVADAPIDTAFDVFQRIGASETKIGSRMQESSKGGYNFYIDQCVVQTPSSGEDYVIVLRPSREAARRTVGITHIWGDELVFRGNGNATDGELILQRRDTSSGH